MPLWARFLLRILTGLALLPPTKLGIPTMQCYLQQQRKVLDLEIVRDEEEVLENLLDGAFSAEIHILLTSVGVSMGDRDLVKPLLTKRNSTFQQECRLVLQHPIKTDPVWPEFHFAIIRWNVNDGSGHIGFVAESTGSQISSWLLSMKSANALLELPATRSLIPAGTSVTAVVISDLSMAAVDESGVSYSPPSQDGNMSTKISSDGSQHSEFGVAVLTVSDAIV